MPGQSNLLLLIRAALLERWRWAWQHLYSLLILSPLVLGMTYWTLARMASYDLALEPPGALIQILLAFLFTVSIIALNLSSASRELYHLRQPAALAETLAVSRAAHLNLALASRLGRTTLALGAALLITRAFLTDESIRLSTIVSLMLFALLAALIELYAALNWIHWRHTRRKRYGLPAIALLTVASCINALLLIVFVNSSATAELARSIATLLPTLQNSAQVIYLVHSLALFFAAVIYLLTLRAHEAWRMADIAYAQRLGRASSRRIDLTCLLKRRRPQAPASLAARDLRLTLRIFSSAVYVACGISLLVIVSLMLVLTSDALPTAAEALGGLQRIEWFSSTWLPASLAIKVACVLTTTAIASILPVLVHHQLPHLWLERSTGATGDDLWRAKLLYARIITLPASLATFLLGVMAALGDESSALPLSYAPALLAESLWLWWLVSSMIGSLAFEMPDRPELAVVVMLTVSLSLGGLSAVMWPMGIAIYGMGFAHAGERGKARAAYYLVEEEV